MLRSSRGHQGHAASDMQNLMSSDSARPEIKIVDEGDAMPRRSMSPFYAWRAVSSFGDRLWPFSVGMFLVTLPDARSLSWVAFYLASRSISQLAFGSMLSKWTVRKSVPYCEAAFVPLVVQKISICVAAALFLVDSSSPALILGAILFSVVGHLGTVTYQPAVNRKWLPTYCDSEVHVNVTNMLKYIDWAIAIVSPLVVGFLMTRFGNPVAAFFILIWQFVSAAVEIAILYHTFVVNKSIFKAASEVRPGSPDQEEPSAHFWRADMFFEPIFKMSRSWRRFSQSDLCWVSISLSLLLFSVTSLDAVTLGYLRLYCINEFSSALIRSAGWLVGIGSMIAYPYIQKSAGLQRTGYGGFIGQSLLVGLSLASFSLPGLNSPTMDESNFCENKSRVLFQTVDHTSHLLLFTTSAIAGRFTLWICDSAVSVTLSDHIALSDRVHFDNVRIVMNSFADLFRLLLVILLPLPSQFGMLVFPTFLAVACAGAAFWLGSPPDLATNLAKKFSPSKKHRK